MPKKTKSAPSSPTANRKSTPKVDAELSRLLDPLLRPLSPSFAAEMRDSIDLSSARAKVADLVSASSRANFELLQTLSRVAQDGRKMTEAESRVFLAKAIPRMANAGMEVGIELARLGIQLNRQMVEAIDSARRESQASSD